MDKEILNILSSYGCKYMADDYKEMLEEIIAFVKKRESAINYTRSCESDSELLPVLDRCECFEPQEEPIKICTNCNGYLE